jgi:hypothetical protein
VTASIGALPSIVARNPAMAWLTPLLIKVKDTRRETIRAQATRAEASRTNPTEPPLFTNRRLKKRYQVKAAAKVMYGATALDLPIRDISLSGIGFDSGGAATFSVGNLCLVALPSHGKLDAMVVGVRAQSVHLQFLQTDSDEVRAFIESQVGAL